MARFILLPVENLWVEWYYNEPCFEGKKVHGICVMGIGDFEWIKQTQLKDQ